MLFYQMTKGFKKEADADHSTEAHLKTRREKLCRRSDENDDRGDGNAREHVIMAFNHPAEDHRREHERRANHRR